MENPFLLIAYFFLSLFITDIPLEERHVSGYLLFFVSGVCTVQYRFFLSCPRIQSENHILIER